MPVAINGVDKQGVYVNGVQVKQALDAANETVNKGIYDETTLSAVDADLAVGKIKLGETIFGFLGTVAPAPTRTYERDYFASLGAGSSYTPTDVGLFSAIMSGDNTGGEGTYELTVQLQDASNTWRTNLASQSGMNAIIGDGSNLKFINTHGSVALYLTIMRFVVSDITYQRLYSADMAPKASYTPASGGLFSAVGEYPGATMFYKDGENKWWYSKLFTTDFHHLLIGDGTNFKVHNLHASTAYWIALFSAN